MVSTDAPVNSIDPYALVEALTGRKVDRHHRHPHQSPPASSTMSEVDYEDLGDTTNNISDKMPQPDSRPNNVRVGAINPYALCESLLGRKIDRCSINTARIMADVLQTDYDELFDMRFNSVLYAGLRLNEGERRAEQLHERDIKILEERDLVTPDLSQVQKLEDLEKLGIKDLRELRVKCARMQNGKVCVIINAHDHAKTVSNRNVTESINELTLPFRRDREHNREGRWTPPNASWQDMYRVMMRNTVRDMINNMRDFHIGLPQDLMMNVRRRELLGYRCQNNANFMGQFDDPVQGASSNSFFIAALFSVFWANPADINRDTRADLCGGRMGMIEEERRRRHPMDMAEDRDREDDNDRRRTLRIKFHDKGGKDNNGRTETVEVNYDIPVNNSSNEPIYCRSSDAREIWPCLYEKAYAKWITGSSADRPDITQTHSGDPVKAMAQINGREPQYYFTNKHSAHDLIGVVRGCCVNSKTITPMVAYTHATGHCYRGANLVANHAYSVLGWASMGEKQYVVLRNPWGVTEPVGLTAYPGLLDRVEPEFWRPAELCDAGGVIALEAMAFKECMACVGIAK